MNEVKIYGLIGYPLGHSFSKKYFTEKFEKEGITNVCYELFPIENIEKLYGLLEKKKDIAGLNATIPYKEQIIPFLSELDESAQNIGAVNCVKVTRKEGELNLKGFNTDAFGFETSLKPLLKPSHKKALILGTGGASKAVEFVLKKLDIECRYVSRTARNNIWGYEDVDSKTLEEIGLTQGESKVYLALLKLGTTKTGP